MKEHRLSVVVMVNVNFAWPCFCLPWSPGSASETAARLRAPATIAVKIVKRFMSFPSRCFRVLISEDAEPAADLAAGEGKDHVRRGSAAQKSRLVAAGVARVASVAQE